MDEQNIFSQIGKEIMRHHNYLCVKKESNLKTREINLHRINKINLYIKTHTGSNEVASKILVLLLKRAKLFK